MAIPLYPIIPSNIQQLHGSKSSSLVPNPWFIGTVEVCFFLTTCVPTQQACRFFRTETDDDLSQLRLFKVADFHHGVSCLFAATGQQVLGWDWLRLERFSGSGRGGYNNKVEEEGRFRLYVRTAREKE